MVPFRDRTLLTRPLSECHRILDEPTKGSRPWTSKRTTSRSYSHPRVPSPTTRSDSRSLLHPGVVSKDPGPTGPKRRTRSLPSSPISI